MKRNESSFRHSHALKAARPVLHQELVAGPENRRSSNDLSQRAQRRLRESEERRRERKARRRERKAKSTSPEQSPE